MTSAMLTTVDSLTSSELSNLYTKAKDWFAMHGKRAIDFYNVIKNQNVLIIFLYFQEP